MRAKEFLSEKRKNPKQNPKTPINDIIINAYQNSDFDEKLDDNNCFVSFTSVDKLGINPKSEWNTPLGIYAYPASYVVKEADTESGMDILPFAGDQPFVNIFQSTGNIINLETLTNPELIEYYRRIADYYAKHSGLPWKKAVDVVEHLIDDAYDGAKFFNVLGGRLWFVTMRIAKLLSSERINDQGNNTHVIWNKLFREIGIDGAYDPGIGIIHTSERTQAVFFSAGVITNVKRYNNKYSPDNTRDMQQHGLDMKTMMDKLNSAKTPSELADLLLDLSDDPEQPFGEALEEYKIASLMQKMKNTPAKQYLLKNYDTTRAHGMSYLPMAFKQAKSLYEIEQLMKQTVYQIGIKYLGHNPLKGQFLQKYPTQSKWQEHLDDLYYNGE